MLLISLMGWLYAAEPMALSAPPVPRGDRLTYQIGPGDVLTLEVIGEPDMSRTVRVAATGLVEVPLAGQVEIGGLTLDAATERITKHLAARYLRNPQVVLDVQAYGSKRVDVSGAVGKPSPYYLDQGQTHVSDLLLKAGGLIDPNSTRAYLYRVEDGTQQVIPVDLERIFRGDMGANLEIQPGDMLHVPVNQNVYVQGSVEKAGAIPYRDGMTATQSLTYAGGAKATASMRGAYILRGNEKIPLNLKRILNGEESDIVLRPGDTIVLPESPI